jgi:hypothetical protein
MAFKDILVRRLIIMIQRLQNPPGHLSEDSQLGGFPIGMELDTIQGEFCGRLTGEKFGFKDILPNSQFPCTQLTEETTLIALAGLILDRSTVSEIEAYRNLLEPQVRESLCQGIADLSTEVPSPAEVKLQDQITVYLPAPDQLTHLQERLNSEFEKYPESTDKH